MADDPSAADRNVEIWKIKKLIKSLEAARGCVRGGGGGGGGLWGGSGGGARGAGLGVRGPPRGGSSRCGQGRAALLAPLGPIPARPRRSREAPRLSAALGAVSPPLPAAGAGCRSRLPPAKDGAGPVAVRPGGLRAGAGSPSGPGGGRDRRYRGRKGSERLSQMHTQGGSSAAPVAGVPAGPSGPLLTRPGACSGTPCLGTSRKAERRPCPSLSAGGYSPLERERGEAFCRKLALRRGKGDENPNQGSLNTVIFFNLAWDVAIRGLGCRRRECGAGVALACSRVDFGCLSWPRSCAFTRC